MSWHRIKIITMTGFAAAALAVGVAVAAGGSRKGSEHDTLFHDCIAANPRAKTPAGRRECQRAARHGTAVEAKLKHEVRPGPPDRAVLGILYIHSVPPGWSAVFVSSSLWTGHLHGSFITVYAGATMNPITGRLERSAVLVGTPRGVDRYLAPAGRAKLRIKSARGYVLLLQAPGRRSLSFNVETREFQ